MYVEQVILQGFKTYMNRTVISGFDPNFNAITGLNGSGKSNILDAIQFLLGSTSKQMLRLKTGLTELIYKEGFAGIQKASVTIKFRCPDKSLRPTGYENCEQLHITRQITKDKITKFFINGINSNLSKVKNLFRSVQLNIQNPHFLVKQGQITKIINLKPLQLLGMIQQTAGTAYYNKTRFESQKIIDRKEQKLDSINEILSSTIRPQMDKLDTDRKRYAAFKQKEALAQKLKNKIKKHQYAVKLTQTRNKQYRLTSLKQNYQRNIDAHHLLVERVVEIQNKIKILKNKGDNQFLKEYNNVKHHMQQKENARKTIKNRLQVIQNHSNKLKQQNLNSQQDLQRLKQEIQWYEKQLIQSQKHLDAFNDLLNDLDKTKNAQDALKLIQKQIQQQKGQVSHFKQELKILQEKRQAIKVSSQAQIKAMKQAEQNMQGMSKSLLQLQRQIQNFKKLSKPNPVQDPQLEAQQFRRLENQRKLIMQQNHRLAFYFNDPHEGFNRSLVKGKLFMIFRIKDSIHQKALEIGAGAKLLNIIIQNQIASQALLKAQSFGKYVTLIPNNKIRFATLKPQTIRFAEQIAKEMSGLAKPAYDLINFANDVKNSILFGFGNFIICSSSQIAKKIAYNPNKGLACKCVTYEGEVFQQGTLTGGSDSNQQFILPRYTALREIDDKIKNQSSKFQAKRRQYQQYQNRINDYRLQQKDIESKISRKQKIKQKLASLNINLKPRDYSQQLNAIQKKVVGLKKQIAEHQKKIQELSGKQKGGNTIQQQKKVIIDDQRKCQRKISDAKKKISLNEVEIQRLANNLKVSQITQKQYLKEIIELQNAESKHIQTIKELRKQFQQLQAKKVKYQKQIALSNSNAQLLATQLDQNRKKQEASDQSMKSMKNEIQNFDKQIVQNQRLLASLLHQNPWLENERVVEVQLDFKYQPAVQEYNQILLDVDKLRKTVKVNVDDHSYQKLNEQYKNLLEKKAILQNDKRTLLTNMHELDEKRTKTLQKCFYIVKGHLQAIFNDLLPGATAHLTLVDDKDVTKGAQLRVHFNKVKKQLSQLSGGQRSLLALSFILALLLYKPSPFYILDEIDSALDLSHTQNIGYMISRRFPQSQFLLISLKQGMFQNANVLYRVHFSEGESKVDRQVLKKKN